MKNKQDILNSIPGKHLVFIVWLIVNIPSELFRRSSYRDS